MHLYCQHFFKDNFIKLICFVFSQKLFPDDSHSTSPEDGTSMASASPRINRFLAREPPDGCEKVRNVPTSIGVVVYNCVFIFCRLI